MSITKVTGDVFEATPTAAGDIPIASAANAFSKIAVGAAGTVLVSRAASSLKLAYTAILNKVIYGLTYANSGGDVTNDIDIAAGGCMDATGAYWLQFAALTKQSDVAWAVGTNAGWLDTGAIGNNPYYFWIIGRSDTGVTDSLLSLSSTAPTMPTSYDFKRLAGYILRAAGAIVLFTTYETEGGGLEFMWTTPTVDINLAATLTTSRRTDAVKVPLNFSVVAKLNVQVEDAITTKFIIVYCPDQSDLVPSNAQCNLGNDVADLFDTKQLTIRTSAAGLIAARADSTQDVYRVQTQSFTWARRN
jgi:hypothetical protein